MKFGELNEFSKSDKSLKHELWSILSLGENILGILNCAKKVMKSAQRYKAILEINVSC